MVRVIDVLVVSILLLSTIFLFRFSPVSSTNKTDRHDIAEILLKVALNTIKQTSLGFWSRSNSVLLFLFFILFQLFVSRITTRLNVRGKNGQLYQTEMLNIRPLVVI